MIARTSVRWRLVAWVTGVLLAVAAVIFVVVYEQTGTELPSRSGGLLTEPCPGIAANRSDEVAPNGCARR